MHSHTLLWESPPAPPRWTQKLPEESPPGFPAQGLWGKRSVRSKERDMARLWIGVDRRSQLWGLHQGYETLEGSWTQRTTIKQCLESNRNLTVGIGKEIMRPVHLLKLFRQKQLCTGAKQIIYLFLSLSTIRKMLGLFSVWSESVVFRLEWQKASLSSVNCTGGTGRVHWYQSPKEAITGWWFIIEFIIIYIL